MRGAEIGTQKIYDPNGGPLLCATPPKRFNRFCFIARTESENYAKPLNGLDEDLL